MPSTPATAAARAEGDRPSKRERPVRTAVVVRTEWLSPDLVRVVFTGDDLVDLPELIYTDHYLKILFPPAGADYRWPFDPEQIKATEPAERWPTTRTYTIRSFDRTANELAIDFVVHGTEGLAGPWAAGAQPGDQLGFRGPGGAFALDVEADALVLVGDEAAIPAIAATLDRADGVQAHAYLEVANRDAEFELRQSPGTTIHWVHRDGRPYGEALSEAVRNADLPSGRLQAFVHGNAEMIKQLRPYLLRDLGLPRDQVSISGYWRTGQTEDRWQATKRNFNQELEDDLNPESATSGG